MEHEPILVDEFPISDDPASEGVVEGTQIPPELEAGGSRTPPPRSRVDLIPPEVIASAAGRFKKRRRFQSLAAEVPVSPSSDQMSNESYDCHLASAAQMAYNVLLKWLLIYCPFSIFPLWISFLSCLL
jgi:hypothetical protein